MQASCATDAGHRLLAELNESRALSDELFDVVREDAFYARPIPERHRIAFYRGHLEAFDWNLIGARVLGLESFNRDFDQLFAFGIDPVGGGLPSDQPSDWPPREAIEDYNQRVRQALDEALAKVRFPETPAPLLRDGYILNVAVEHRLMHAGTLAYMLHQLPVVRKIRQAGAPAPEAPPARAGMVEIPAGTATLGRARGDGFGWDNEFETQSLSVPRFAIDLNSVTNGQFLEFMKAGGYKDQSLWKPEDWEWLNSRELRQPNFWIRRGQKWFYRGMFEEVPLPLNDPVYVSHAEASAYARWKSKALPTEAQFHRAAYATPQGTERQFPWGDEPPTGTLGNFDFQRWDPVPVGSFPANASAFGVADLVGNGYEWTSTVFAPFPGFEPFSFYPGYSANFFDGKHYVMKGGEARTAARLLRRSFRNWFRPHYSYVYAKFRCVTN
jgi:ergothioneine biosynthesis protein EgtB